MHRNKFLSVLLAICMIVGLLPWTAMPVRADWDGSTIASKADWNAFVYAVENDTFGGTVTLTADIEIDSMVGTKENPFSGTFNGGGHKLTVALESDGEYTAPFRYIKDATIRGLHTAGTVTASDKYAAGLIASSDGNVTVERCISGVTVKSSVNGDGTHGGFVGKVEDGTTTFTDCLFDGKLLTTNGTDQCGGFVGWVQGTVKMSGCLYGPAAIGDGETEVQEGSGLYKSHVFYRITKSGCSLDKCYYTRPFGTTQGSNAGGMTVAELAEALGSAWTVKNNEAVPITDPGDLTGATVTGVKSIYKYTGSAINLEYTVTAMDGTELAKDTHYTATLRKDGETVQTVQDTGSYTLTITATENGGYNGSKTVGFSVKNIPTSISSTQDWNNFAEAVNNGTDYADMIVTLTADIEVSTMVGESETNSFRGTFEGGGHTLRFDYTATEDDAAPFRFIKNATIRNLAVTGTIRTEKKFAAGIAAHSYGGTITRCISSVTIDSDISGDGTHAGFVAVNEGDTLNIADCLFNGEMLGGSTNSCGGFVGWANGTLQITRCLLDPAEISISKSGSENFARNKDVGSLDCYYIRSLGGWQGTNASEMSVSELVDGRLGSEWAAVGGKAIPKLSENSLICASVEGVNSTYPYTGEPIDVACTVTALDGTELVKDTHYTVTFEKDGATVQTVENVGGYTLTIAATAKGGYSGTRTFHFTVIPPASYVRYTLDTQGKVTRDAGGSATLYTAVAGDSTAWGGDAWYVADGEVTINKRVNVSGTANLILCDNAVLTLNEGVNLTTGNTLNIYGQSDGTGKLIARCEALVAAGIGGCEGTPSCGTLNIHGGVIEAVGGAEGSYGAAGIGGYATGSGGAVTVYDGTVKATGQNCNAGIGGGYGGSSSGNGGSLTVYGGTVEAKSELGAAIGAGEDGADNGSITVHNADMAVYGGEEGITKEIASPYTERAHHMMITTRKDPVVGLTVGDFPVVFASEIEDAGQSSGSASVSVESRGVVLTLDGFQYKKEEQADAALSAVVRYEGETPLVIVLKGENAVEKLAKNNELRQSFGIYSKTADLVIEGSGSMTACGASVDTSSASESAPAQSSGIYCGGSVTVKGDVILTAKGGEVSTQLNKSSATSSGIYCLGAFSACDKADVSANGGDAITAGGDQAYTEASPAISCGIYCGGAFSACDSASVRANAGTSTTEKVCSTKSYGIYNERGGIAVSDRAEVTAYGDTANAKGENSSAGSYGVYSESGSIAVSGGELEGKGGAASATLSPVSYGVRSGDTLTVGSGALNGYAASATVSGENGYQALSYGVYAEKALTVNGGELIGKGDTAKNEGAEKSADSYGVYSKQTLTVNSGELAGEGGNVTAGYLAYSYGVYAKSGLAVSGRLAGEGGATECTDSDGCACSYGAYAEDTLTVSGGELTGEGGKASAPRIAYSYGVYAKSGLAVSSGELTGKGGATDDDAKYPYSYGVYAKSGLAVSSGVRLTGTGEAYGISGDVTLDKCCLTASGGKKAINGTVKAADAPVDGWAWTDADGTKEETALRIDANGQELSYKRVAFSTAYVVLGEFSWDTQESTLIATVISPGDSLLIVAIRDENGRQSSVKTIPVKGSGTEREIDTGIVGEPGLIARLMLVNSEYAPLCKAVSEEASTHKG